MNTKYVSIVAAGLALAGCTAAIATPLTEFGISYSDADGDTGTGTVYAQVISAGVYLAESGTFTFNTGTYAGFTGTLQPTTGHGLWSGTGPGYEYTAYDGTDLGFDDLIGKVGSTYTLSWWGLLFNDTSFHGAGGNGLVFAPSTSGGQGYNANFGGQNYGGFNGAGNQPWFDTPTATITVSVVPDGGCTCVLLGLGVSSLLIFRSRRPSHV